MFWHYTPVYCLQIFYDWRFFFLDDGHCVNDLHLSSFSVRFLYTFFSYYFPKVGNDGVLLFFETRAMLLCSLMWETSSSRTADILMRLQIK